MPHSLFTYLRERGEREREHVAGFRGQREKERESRFLPSLEPDSGLGLGLHAGLDLSRKQEWDVQLTEPPRRP